MSRAERLFGLTQFLQARTGRALAEIERHFSVSERTVFRDLAMLEEQGIPVEHLDTGRYRVRPAHGKPPALDSTDLALVRVALAETPGEEHGPLGRRFSRMIQKVESALRGRGGGGRTPHRDLERVRAELERLIAQRTTATLFYRSLSGGGESARTVDPWQLFERAGGWYLVARCHLLDEPRLFRLERIRSVHAALGRFEVPEGFEVERFLAEAWSSFLPGPPHPPA